MENERWFSLDDIQPSNDTSCLYCISVDNDEHQFLAGNIAVSTFNTDEGKADDALKGEAGMIIGSIARLGRAAGVHLVIATQRPDASIIPGETRANLSVRVNCGRTKSTASSMILENSEGTRVKSNPRGRLYVQIDGNGDHGQGFFAPQEWIDEYLASQGLNQDGTPINGKKKSRLANIVDMNEFDGADLDSREGVDNESAIERIREEDENSDFDPDSYMEELEEESTPAERTDGFGGLELKGSGNDDKWHRPEDDWDDELEGLIEENFGD